MQRARPAGVLRYFGFSAYWFGFNLHWTLILLFLMPADVLRFVGQEQQGTYLGWLAGTLALIPLVLPPFLGAWSDRIGKRKSFMVWGTAINILGLAIMFFAPGYWVYALGYVLVQLGNNVASTPYAALIPDTVSQNEKGTASGVLGFFQLSSQVAGGIVPILLQGSREGQYLAIALVLLLTTLITLRSVPEPQIKRNVEPLNLRVFLRPEYRDFRWVFLTRALVESGRFAIQPFLFYYLRDVVKTFPLGPLRLALADQALGIILLLLSFAGAITAIVGGVLSDRIGKKRIVFLAGGIMASAAAGFALTQSYALAVLIGLVFGLGYGAYISVDWALATSVLPDPSKHARDMGIWHMALVFPQLFQGLFGQVLDAGNRAGPGGGYPILFAIAVIFFVLGTMFISRVRGVR
jgi:MFS family permease